MDAASGSGQLLAQGLTTSAGKEAGLEDVSPWRAIQPHLVRALGNPEKDFPVLVKYTRPLARVSR
ncbi:hypothetical protein ACFFGX_07495 [Azorhizophilus paspali]|uniref:Uncharacterized protein n=1 Tax=Azorhizophilus paspali TaxID=69963 RepID=A0ABV6SIU2_AZOPA